MDNGHVIEGTCICINYWKKDDGRKYLRFLTHLNSDYSCGFRSDFQECIHTSPMNAWLITNRIGVNPKYVVSLAVEDSHILYDESTKKTFSVTVVDANYNGGSVMFIFQGDFGNILYTGYFRYNMDMLQHPVLKSIIETKTMDIVYFDNTYAAEHCVFPSKEEALEEILKLLSQHPDHTIVFGTESFGKEELLFAVANYLNEQIPVSESKFKVMSKMGFQEMFTTDSESSRITLMDIKDITINAISALKMQLGPVLTILPSALYHTVLPISSVPFHEAEAHNIHVVPYSSHSSHFELIEFIHCIKPDSVIPIIDVLNYKYLSHCLDRFWANIWKNCIVPPSIMFLPSGLKSPLNLSPPDATVFDSQNDDGTVIKLNKLDDKLVPKNNNHFSKSFFFENVCSSVESNINDENTLSNETMNYDYTSESNVAINSGYEKTKINIASYTVDEDINRENNIDCFDISVSSTDSECENESSYLDSIKYKYEKGIVRENILPRVGQNCESILNNIPKEITNLDCGKSQQAGEYIQHPLRKVKHKFESSTNVDKDLSSQITEHCQYPLNTANYKCKNNTDTDKQLLYVAEHFECISDNASTKCDKGVNTDKVSKMVKKNFLPSMGHCGKPDDLDVRLLIKTYEEEKKQSAQYRYGYLEHGSISNEVTKVKSTELNIEGCETCLNKSGQANETVIKICSDSFPSSSSPEIHQQSLATPEHSMDGTRKRKLLDSVIYNKCKLNKASIAVCVYERNDNSGSYSIEKKKIILRCSD